MLVPFDRVKSACETFTAEWEPGSQADLPSYLLKVASDDQATLLRNLLEYEIHKRREHGESPRAEDYLAQLPDHTAVIRQAFLETSRLGLTGDQLSANKELPREQLPAPRLGKFRLVRELGRGGMGSVFEAVHMQRGHRVALKTLPAVTPETLHRFKREFRMAAELTHPNLVSLHTLESDGGQYFITMDLVGGVDFRSWVRPENILDEQRLRATWPQLVAAVMALHAQGVVHRDLKPHNVLVTPDGRVVVLDFGLVAELAGATVSLGKIAGTPTYMAPEQAAGQAVGPPADWYAVGVMLYEALAGRLPFQSTNVWEVLRQKQERDAPPLPDEPKYPPELAELCMKLLARAPADRPDPLEIAGVV
jgi:serine/threonine protein kinase